MSALSPTLQTLLCLGFKPEEPQYGMPCVSYDLPHLPLTCCDGVSRHFQEVVLVSGVFNNGRTLSGISHEIPPNLETEESAAAWLAYALKSTLKQISSEPEWVTLGRANQMLVPMVAEQVAYQQRPFCLIDADFARILRKRFDTLIVDVPDAVPLSVCFDGSLLRIAVAEDRLEVPASGSPWNGRIEVAEAARLEFPKRISDTGVDLDYWQDRMRLGNRVFPATWIEGADHG
ncbi:hypothetical protein SAMN05444273_1039 [Litoreibacter ascidiaceicola]|uniref:Uncharacterized protein n=1 Tax=Litoreibacter ascidiaceicola TaxID=1486859 RepID=A0A1M4X1R4_9RHOB|nr:hypothetical protein [Litoreibacter ascidiaceicola]SHE87429.1 hypothetical protein SAMN05444273_1039 [Litoreibacter ascidiaceicola]